MRFNIAATLRATLCALGLHTWISEPHVSRDEYGTQIDHYCPHCYAERFDLSDHYTTAIDRIRSQLPFPWIRPR